ncbi:hypothetical protein McanMca71_006866 [Microsporum canis]|uniref:DUF7137 domain-containing protein n=1 Tax=Arthroderma otae (strain ATCC MYA-4605 / CBS 113480) TaxID=554155 RepID=C5FQ18_ARTOC|nr:conserved hypothetical protein [Microsporum canis CBS 113480]EEQ31971.1 conserved hypothetical protein [Microsporum canis CBS 113480]
MKSIKVTFVLLSLVILLSLVSAYSPPQNTGIAIRADSSSGDSSQTGKPTQTSQSNSESSGSGSGSSENTSDKPTPTEKDGSSKTNDKGTKTTKKPTSTFVDPRKPPGGIVMVTPGVFDPSTYVKIGDKATFAWNYTSLVITPSAVDVVAYCQQNDHYYTITSNKTVEETGRVVWDTEPYKTAGVRLLVEHYTLIVHDVKRGPTDPAPAGELGNSRPFIFGVYSPHSDPNLRKRAMGSAAISATEHQALWFMFGMVGITIASFTWFASGLGLFA